MGSALPLLFFGGKGGVGKTTMATASATLLAREGARTLLVSTDPAHSTSDLLGSRLGNTPTQVADGLWALEIDAEADADVYLRRIAAEAEQTVSRAVLPAVRRHLDAARHGPGTVEAALFDRFSQLIAQSPATWDRVVFDTAPTGHTLRLLALPDLLTTWVEGMVRQREKVAGSQRMLRNLAGDDRPVDDPVVERLRRRRDRFRNTRRRLLHDAAFWLVLVPERLPIEETDRALHTLEAGGLTVAGLIVNRVFPAEAGGEFMRARLEQQAEHLGEIDRRFAGRRLVRVAHEPRDVTGRDGLEAVAAQLSATVAG